MTTLDWAYWVDGDDTLLVTGADDFLVFGIVGASEVETLTAAPPRQSLVSPKRRQYTSTLSVTLTELVPWIDDTADPMVDNTADALVFADVVSGSSNPIALTAPPDELALEAE